MTRLTVARKMGFCVLLYSSFVFVASVAKFALPDLAEFIWSLNHGVSDQIIKFWKVINIIKSSKNQNVVDLSFIIIVKSRCLTEVWTRRASLDLKTLLQMEQIWWNPGKCFSMCRLIRVLSLLLRWHMLHCQSLPKSPVTKLMESAIIASSSEKLSTAEFWKI